MKALTKRQAGLRARDPFADLFDLDAPFKNIPAFDRALDFMFGASESLPRANVTKTETGCTIDIEAPGLKRDDFKVETVDGVLTVSAVVEKESKRADHREFYRNSFSRSWTLPDGVHEDEIKASYEAGILSIDVPYETPAVSARKVRTIDIK